MHDVLVREAWDSEAYVSDAAAGGTYCLSCMGCGRAVLLGAMASHVRKL